MEPNPPPAGRSRVGPMRARAVIFTGPRAVEIREYDVAEPTGPDQLVVHTVRSGISSGTELLAYRGEIDPDLPLDSAIGALSGTFRYPFGYGYSCVGRVERSTTPAHAEGDLVFAFHPHQDRFVAGAADVVALGDVDPELATLFPLVETALQISLDAGPVAHLPVVVFGLGAVGRITAELLRRAGADVIAVEPQPERRAAAVAAGLRAVDPVDAAQIVGAATSGVGVPLAVEVSGAPGALAAALPLLAHEGIALVGSWYGVRPVTLPLGAEFHRRRLTLRSTQVSTIPAAQSAVWTRERRRASARRLLTELPLRELATHEFDFAAAAEAYRAVDAGTPGLLHATLRYPL